MLLTSLAIRPARVSDLDAIEALERAAFIGDRLSRRSLKNFIRAGDRLIAWRPRTAMGWPATRWSPGARAEGGRGSIRSRFMRGDPAAASAARWSRPSKTHARRCARLCEAFAPRSESGQQATGDRPLRDGLAIAASDAARTITRTARPLCVWKSGSQCPHRGKNRDADKGSAVGTRLHHRRSVEHIVSPKSRRLIESREPRRASGDPL